MYYKKRIALALTTVGLVVILTAGIASASSGTAVVSAHALRLRQGPSTSTTTLTTLIEGTSVKLLSDNENGWYKVSYKNYTGYMSADYLTIDGVIPPDDDTAEDATAEEPSTGSDASPSEDSSRTVFPAVVNAGPLNVRSGPGTKHSKIGSLKKGASVTVIGIEDDWYKIESGDLSGYVFAEYISKKASEPEVIITPSPDEQYAFTPDETVAKEAIVLRGPVNIRSGPGAKYVLHGKLNVGTKITIYNLKNGWYQMTCDDLQGYVHAGYIMLTEDLKSSPVGAAAAEMAKSLLGCRYVYGAEGPNTFDCSGLSYYIYGKLGYPIARGSSGQYLRSGYFVPMSEMEPGDLIFIFDPKYDSSGGTYPTTHMGIYVGDGKFIHASTTSNSVQYDNVYNSYYTKYIVGVKRIG